MPISITYTYEIVNDPSDRDEWVMNLDAINERAEEHRALLDAFAGWVNLTPHALVLHLSTGTVVTLAASGDVARVATTPGARRPGIIPMLDAPTYGDVVGLPDPQVGVTYVVSALVAAALRERGAHRPDVVCPDTGATAVRVDGQVVAVRQFVAATTAAPRERDVIVTYLRARARGFGAYMVEAFAPVEEVADGIERGDYLTPTRS